MLPIIDIHTHLAFDKIFPAAFVEGMVENFDQLLQGSAGSGNRRISADKIRRLIRAFLKDDDCQQLLKQMDKSNIQKSVLLIIDGGVGMGEAPLDLEGIYEVHAELVRHYPERFAVFGSGDPRRGEAGLELFKKGIQEYGFAGLKLYPPMGYGIDHPSLDPWYAYCDAQELPVLIHTGPSLKSLANELAEPTLISEVAPRFPKAKFILAHAGFRLFRPEVLALLEHPNVYADIAGFHSVFPTVNDEMKSAMGAMFTPGIQDKVLFGTDWPLFNLLTPLQRIAAMIPRLYHELHPEGDEIALRKVMYGNASRVLGLEKR